MFTAAERRNSPLPSALCLVEATAYAAATAAACPFSENRYRR